ncbi:hypothetical protein PG985_007888 [Apiospora marii]|uniref:Uncharacterized protein n=1 Tax=Apiospora marii TaxID=335849 RepID=A0ABR1R910_9PEZI
MGVAKVRRPAPDHPEEQVDEEEDEEVEPQTHGRQTSYPFKEQQMPSVSSERGFCATSDWISEPVMVVPETNRLSCSVTGRAKRSGQVSSCLFAANTTASTTANRIHQEVAEIASPPMQSKYTSSMTIPVKVLSPYFKRPRRGNAVRPTCVLLALRLEKTGTRSHCGILPTRWICQCSGAHPTLTPSKGDFPLQKIAVYREAHASRLC